MDYPDNISPVQHLAETAHFVAAMENSINVMKGKLSQAGMDFPGRVLPDTLNRCLSSIGVAVDNLRDLRLLLERTHGQLS